MTDFVREERYIVIKRKDLSEGHQAFIRGYLDQIRVNTVECVVVESDWHIYEEVWDLVKQESQIKKFTNPI